MSRIGNKPIHLPKGVSLTTAGGRISVKGPKGELERAIVAGITIDEADGAVHVKRPDDSKQARANHGLMRALLNNMVTGVSAGFERQLEVQGVGYKAEIKGNALVMALGYSHPIEYPFPPGVTIEADKKNNIVVRGIDREAVGQAASEIRGFRSPDSYKGKGVRYVGETVRLKAGKSGT